MLRISCSILIVLSYIGSQAIAQDLLGSSQSGSVLQNDLGRRDEFRRSNGFTGSNQSAQPDGSIRPNDLVKHHNELSGKPCLAMEGYTKPELINKTIFEHWIKATNSCGQHIELRVCYRGSEDCIGMNVPPWESKQAVLGIQPMMKDFQFDTKEKF